MGTKETSRYSQDNHHRMQLKSKSIAPTDSGPRNIKEIFPLFATITCNPSSRCSLRIQIPEKRPANECHPRVSSSRSQRVCAGTAFPSLWLIVSPYRSLEIFFSVRFPLNFLFISLPHLTMTSRSER